MKLVISDKDGKAYQTEVPADKTTSLYGLKIGQELEGGAVGVPGYKLIVTGGSDKEGFPMRRDSPGGARKALLLASGTGIRPRKKRAGEVRRVGIRGNTVSESTQQLNTKVAGAGEKKLAEIFPQKEKKAEEKKK